MSIPHTKFGHFVLTELGQLSSLSTVIFWDNEIVNNKLTQEYELRKARAIEQIEKVLQQLGNNQKPEDVNLTVENGADENKAYTETLERIVSESLVSRAIDLYHWYLRQVLEFALNRDRSLIRSWGPLLGLNERKIVKIENEPIAAPVISKLFRGREGIVRNLVHEHLNVINLSALPLLVEVRNCIVHQLGWDVEGKIEPLIAECPEIGIMVVDKRVLVSASAAYESIGRVFSDISIIDQLLANVLELQTNVEPISMLNRRFS